MRTPGPLKQPELTRDEFLTLVWILLAVLLTCLGFFELTAWLGSANGPWD